MRVFALVSAAEFITVHSTLYTFLKREDAEWFLTELRKEMPLEDVGVEEMDAMAPFRYVEVHSTLRLISVKNRQKGGQIKEAPAS